MSDLPDSAAPASHQLRATGKTLLVVAGGYGVASALVAMLSVGLVVATGMAPSEAAMLTVMLGVVIYLLLLVWGFSARRLAQLAVIWALLAGSGFVLAALVGSA